MLDLLAFLSGMAQLGDAERVRLDVGLEVEAGPESSVQSSAKPEVAYSGEEYTSYRSAGWPL